MITITAEEYRSLVEASVKLDIIERIYTQYDKYDLQQAMKPIVSVLTYEQIKANREAFERKMLEAKEGADNE